MRHSTTNNNNNNNRPNFNNNRNNQNKYRRPTTTSGTAQNRTDAIYDRDEMSDVVNPAQRRHASSQQTKFLDLAKNAKQIGDRVEMEYYMQHVEHYTRVLNLAEFQDNMRNQQRQPVRHAPQVQAPDNDNDGGDEHDEEQTEVAPANEETEEQRLARVERNRAKRRNRRLKRNNQTMQPQEQAEHVATSNNVEMPNENTAQEHNNSSQQPSEIKHRSPLIKRIARNPLNNDGQADLQTSNSGELLRDVLPAPKMDS